MRLKLFLKSQTSAAILQIAIAQAHCHSLRGARPAESNIRPERLRLSITLSPSSLAYHNGRLFPTLTKHSSTNPPRASSPPQRPRPPSTLPSSSSPPWVTPPPPPSPPPTPHFPANTPTPSRENLHQLLLHRPLHRPLHNQHLLPPQRRHRLERQSNNRRRGLHNLLHQNATYKVRRPEL